MSRAPLFLLYDRLVDGKLADILRETYASEGSLTLTAQVLRDQYDIDVNATTVSRWIKEFVREPAA